MFDQAFQTGLAPGKVATKGGEVRSLSDFCFIESAVARALGIEPSTLSALRTTLLSEGNDYLPEILMTAAAVSRVRGMLNGAARRDADVALQQCRLSMPGAIQPPANRGAWATVSREARASGWAYLNGEKNQGICVDLTPVIEHLLGRNVNVEPAGSSPIHPWRLVGEAPAAQ